MKKFILFLSVTFILHSGINAQTTDPVNSFTIENNNTPEKLEFYKTAILKADMESYRLQDKNVAIKFEEGFTCVLLSAKTLSKKGLTIDINSYKKEFSESFKMPVFSIAPNGNIKAGYTKVITK